MSPEDRAATSALVRLHREVADDRAAMTKHVAELADARARWKTTPDDHAARVLAGHALHGWYGALEGLLRAFPAAARRRGTRWRELASRLPSQATVAVPSVRPEILPRALFVDLQRLLTFLHFFRHGYGADLDRSLIEAEAARLDALRPTVDAALDAFARFLEQAAAT